MRPLAYGLLVCFGSGILWFLSGPAAAAEVIAGEIGLGVALMYIFGALFYFSLPAVILIEFFMWIRRRRE